MDCFVAALLAMTNTSGHAQIAIGELHRRALGIGDVSEQPAVEPEERLHRGEEAISAGIAHHDAGGLRRYFNDVGV
jgi:hypothetical protein